MEVLADGDGTSGDGGYGSGPTAGGFAGRVAADGMAVVRGLNPEQADLARREQAGAGAD
ncbi:MAG: hypothetical protein ACOC1S_04005 [bacterium]